MKTEPGSTEVLFVKVEFASDSKVEFASDSTIQKAQARVADRETIEECKDAAIASLHSLLDFYEKRQQP